MSPSADKMKALRNLSNQLNTETDFLNKSIEAFEKELADMNLGVSVWLNKQINEEAVSGTDSSRGSNHFESWDLGYIKFNGQWRICAQHTRYQYLHYDHAIRLYEVDEDTVSVIQTLPLRDAPRLVRVSSIDYLDALLDALIKKIGGFIEDIQEARAEATMPPALSIGGLAAACASALSPFAAELNLPNASSCLPSVSDIAKSFMVGPADAEVIRAAEPRPKAARTKRAQSADPESRPVD